VPQRRYEIELAATAARSFRKLAASHQRRIGRAIDSLSVDPRPNGCVKLAGEENLYRIRSGDYRILYQIRDRVLLVLVVAVGHRREIYRK
jgi:mRNA interferase RelE/StbE